MPVQFQIELPPEAEAGLYADFASVWYTQNSFVIDFVATKQPAMVQEDPETGAKIGVVPAKVVSRIRIPPQQVFELARVLTQHLDAWEIQTGVKQPPPDGPFPGTNQ